MPRLYQWCGKQDPLYQDNCRLRDYLTSQGFPLTWEDSDGDHQWEYWDAKIANVLQWIESPARNKPLSRSFLKRDGHPYSGWPSQLLH